MWKYLPKRPKKNLATEFELRKVGIKEFEKLKKFHYISTGRVSIPMSVHGLYHNNILYAIVVYNLATTSHLRARSKTVLGKILDSFKTRGQRFRFLNKNCRNISRIVVHPSVRGIGLVSRLINETWPKLGVRFIEGYGFMAYYRNFHPKGFSYYIKVRKTLTTGEFFHKKTKNEKGSMLERLKTPVQTYGYVLYINKNNTILL